MFFSDNSGFSWRAGAASINDFNVTSHLGTQYDPHQRDMSSVFLTLPLPTSKSKAIGLSSLALAMPPKMGHHRRLDGRGSIGVEASVGLDCSLTEGFGGEFGISR